MSEEKKISEENVSENTVETVSDVETILESESTNGSTTPNSTADEINRFHKLYLDGVITKEEFNQKKNALLSEKREDPVKKNLTSVFANKKITAVIVALLVMALGIFIYSNTLFGDDKTAYDLLIKASSSFKYPSSMKLISGTVVEGKMFANISAENALGQRSTSCYFISDEGHILSSSSSACLGASYAPLNVEKINKKLQKELNK